jgi:hypothetical protein
MNAYHVQCTASFEAACNFELTNVNFKVIRKLTNLKKFSSALILKSTALGAPYSVPPIYGVCFTGEVMRKESTVEIYKYYNDSNIHSSFK